MRKVNEYRSRVGKYFRKVELYLSLSVCVLFSDGQHFSTFMSVNLAESVATGKHIRRVSYSQKY